MLGMRPDAYYVSVLDIEPNALVEHGYRAVLLDLDNTLQPRGTSELSPEVIAWVRSLKDVGLGVALVSNSVRKRTLEAARTLDIPLVRNAKKPFTRGYVQACARLGVACNQAVMIGDQSYTDVLGAHRVGMDAILVVPQSGADPLHTHLLRMLDRRAVHGMRAIGSAS